MSGCLKLLPLEELEHLDVPLSKEFTTSPVRKVLYMSEDDTPVFGRTIVLSGQNTNATRFNLFTGNQTLDQRENSFKVISCVAHMLIRFWLIYDHNGVKA